MRTPFTVHRLDPFFEGAPTRWSVVGMGPVAYCDSPEQATALALKLNTGEASVCPLCDAANEHGGRHPVRFTCHSCGTVLVTHFTLY